VSLAALTLVLTMAAPAAADGGGERYTIMVAGTLTAHPDPVLDELESLAELEGITLEEAIDQYVADAAGPDWQQHEPGYPWVTPATCRRGFHSRYRRRPADHHS
jgi:hypothetical protein